MAGKEKKFFPPSRLGQRKSEVFWMAHRHFSALEGLEQWIVELHL